ncbi:MAG: hypothetical protein FWB72_06610 [Firmicutes bacterium]|nr:hypothetical protein [Bacillota bacterium]
MEQMNNYEGCLLDTIEGPLTVPTNKDGTTPFYDLKALTQYADAVGKELVELTNEEREQFFLYWI